MVILAALVSARKLRGNAAYVYTNTTGPRFRGDDDLKYFLAFTCVAEPGVALPWGQVTISDPAGFTAGVSISYRSHTMAKGMDTTKTRIAGSESSGDVTLR